MNSALNLERYLPYGYLFLVVMGIIKESVHYYQLGINILRYSSITDILMSPIASMTSHPITFFTVLICMILGLNYPKIVAKYSHKKWAQKTIDLQDVDKLSKEEIANHLAKKSIQFAAVLVISIFLGMGFGEGMFASKRIKNGDIKFKHTLTTISGEKQEIYLLNSNSLYYFFVPKGSKKIQIMPIAAVKQLEITQNRMLD